VVLRIDVQNDGLNFLTLLQNLRGMLDPARRYIRNVNQTIDTLLDFDERSKVRQVPNAAGDNGIDRVAFSESGPGIGFGLLEAKRNSTILEIDIQHDGFDIL